MREERQTTQARCTPPFRFALAAALVACGCVPCGQAAGAAGFQDPPRDLIDARIERILESYGSADPAVRDSADRELLKVGAPGIPILKERLARGLPLEARNRVRKVVGLLQTDQANALIAKGELRNGLLLLAEAEGKSDPEAHLREMRVRVGAGLLDWMERTSVGMRFPDPGPAEDFFHDFGWHGILYLVEVSLGPRGEYSAGAEILRDLGYRVVPALAGVIRDAGAPPLRRMNACTVLKMMRWPATLPEMEEVMANPAMYPEWPDKIRGWLPAARTAAEALREVILDPETDRKFRDDRALPAYRRICGKSPPGYEGMKKYPK